MCVQSRTLTHDMHRPPRRKRIPGSIGISLRWSKCTRKSPQSHRGLRKFEFSVHYQWLLVVALLIMKQGDDIVHIWSTEVCTNKETATHVPGIRDRDDRDEGCGVEEGVGILYAWLSRGGGGCMEIKDFLWTSPVDACLLLLLLRLNPRTVLF